MTITQPEGPMRWIRYVLVPRLRQQLENLQVFAAWLCPHWLVRWCGVRMGAHATTGRFCDQVVPELTMMDALSRWEDRSGGDRAGRVRWAFVGAVLLLLGAALSLLSCSGEASASSAPRPKGTSAVAIAAAGDTVRVSWVYKAPLAATDTAIVVFSQRTATGTGFTNLTCPAATCRTRGLTAWLAIAAPAAGSFDSVRVCVRVKRVGAADSPNPCVKARRNGPLEPHPGADSLDLTISSVIVKPDSARTYAIRAGQTVPTDSNQVQFCAGVRLSDDRVILASPSDSIAVCPGLFASVPGFTRSVGAARIAVPMGGLNITIEGGEPVGEVDAEGKPVNVWRELLPRVEGAVKMGGEWWLTKPLPVVAVS